MARTKRSLLVPMGVVLAAVILPIVVFFPREEPPRDTPRAHLPARPVHTDHGPLFADSLADGPAVTRACLECHPEAADQVMHTAHWSWESEPQHLPGRQDTVVLGKKHALNNFCIGIAGNWPACTACHAGYGWVDHSFDFANREAVDCLVCHDQSGQYRKDKGGLPAEGVDLAAAARSVALPTRRNCGSCHFSGGGGDAVKHGDLDNSLNFPDESLDVHMGLHDMQCIDCHRGSEHRIGGTALSVTPAGGFEVACTDCHSPQLHKDDRITAHLDAVACQTCHIPYSALKTATKTHWDWSTAGQDLPQDPHAYLKIKGSFTYERHLRPEYAWYNGQGDHYVLGETIDPADTTDITRPLGDIRDTNARIWPFKVHYARQIYDTELKHLLQPKTFGEGGYWKEFDWDQAARLGAEAVGLPYSGHFGFADTRMFWPTTHMVAPAAEALQCLDCHGEEGPKRMDWKALGYEGDPMVTGPRDTRGSREVSHAR